MSNYFDDEEPEPEPFDFVPLDVLDDEPSDPLRNADWTGLAEDFDGEALIDNLLSGEAE